MSRKSKEEIAIIYQQMQDYICKGLEEGDGQGKFVEDKWERSAGGGGRTRIFENGAIIEKGGVAFSAVHGPTPEKILSKLGLQQADFFATGVSIVLHPHSPMVPIIHMNIRYFEMENGVHWFGGGIDLTPHYIVPEDATYFHQKLKETCDAFDLDYYPKFKNWADDYFYLKHREETRGIGGIFYDRLSADSDEQFQSILDFSLALGRLFRKCTPTSCKRTPSCLLDRKKKRGKISEEEDTWSSIWYGMPVPSLAWIPMDEQKVS